MIKLIAIVGVILFVVAFVKRAMLVIEAKKRIGFFFFYPKAFMQVEGISVIESNDLILAMTGSKSGAALFKDVLGVYRIFVTSDVRNAPNEVFNAILGHELGHYKLGHLGGEVTGLLNDKEMEIAADNYSIELGNDMNAALKWLMKKDYFAIPALLTQGRVSVGDVVDAIL